MIEEDFSQASLTSRCYLNISVFRDDFETPRRLGVKQTSLLLRRGQVQEKNLLQLARLIINGW
jgi:hypothetical protein